jgi:polyhydroxyalkanoate synthesis regulator phasin
MRTRRIAVVALSGALIAGGAGVAIAAATKDDAKKSEQAVLDDAAARLDVTPQKLHDALAAAQDAQLDQAVKDGDLTQKQADAIKAARQQSGTVLGPPGPRGGPGMPGGPRFFGGPGGPDLHGRGMRDDLVTDIAKALGTTEAKLMASLRAGTSLADVAKANGKSLSDVRAAVKAGVKTRLDKAVKDGDLTQKQADEMLANLDDKVAAIGSAKGGLRMRGEHHRFFGGPPPAGVPKPGAFVPGEQGEQGAPDIPVPDGVTS